MKNSELKEARFDEGQIRAIGAEKDSGKGRRIMKRGTALFAAYGSSR